MPIDYRKYPIEWKTEIRPRILARANNCCEVVGCGLPNGSFGYRAADGTFYHWKDIEDALENHGKDYFDTVLKNNINSHGQAKRGIKIVLTIAHLDHDVSNNIDENLMAMCQRCHLHYDLEYHKTNATATRNKKKGLQNLF